MRFVHHQSNLVRGDRMDGFVHPFSEQLLIHALTFICVFLNNPHPIHIRSLGSGRIITVYVVRRLIAS